MVLCMTEAPTGHPMPSLQQPSPRASTPCMDLLPHLQSLLQGPQEGAEARIRLRRTCLAVWSSCAATLLRRRTQLSHPHKINSMTWPPGKTGAVSSPYTFPVHHLLPNQLLLPLGWVPGISSSSYWPPEPPFCAPLP